MTCYQLFAMFLIIVCSRADACLQKRVQVGVVEYQPYCNSAAEGMACDLIGAAFKAAGCEIDYHVASLRRGKVLLFNQQVDAMLAADIVDSFNNDELESVHLFSLLPALFFYSPNYSVPETLETLADLKGHSVGMTPNDDARKLFERFGLFPVTIGTPQQLIRMLKIGRIDLAYTAQLTGFYLIQNYAGDDAENFDYLRINKLEINLNFSQRNTRIKQIRALFEKGLRLIWNSGEYRRILESYWGKGNVPQAVFHQQYPIQGADQSSVIDYLSAPRDSSGQIVPSFQETE